MPGGYFSRVNFLERRQGELPKFHYQEGKRCMLVSVELDADLSRGCAHPAARLLISTTHPLALDSRIDSERRALATPLVRVYARLWKGPSEKPLLALRYMSPLLDTTTPASASL